MSLHVGGVFSWKGRPVYITGGSYMGTYGISNFWYWRAIRKDGSLGKSFNGYDNKGEFKSIEGAKVETIVHLPEKP